jgi:hypothetical protein
MKSRIATSLIVMCMFMMGTAFATNPVNKKIEASKAVVSILKQELKYPKLSKDDKSDCCVLVRLIINKDGSFTVDCANSTNPELKKHVTQAIEKIDKKDLVRFAGQQFNYKINFKLI